MTRYTVRVVIRSSSDLKVMVLLEEHRGFLWTQANTEKSLESKFISYVSFKILIPFYWPVSVSQLLLIQYHHLSRTDLIVPTSFRYIDHISTLPMLECFNPISTVDIFK